MYPVMFFEMKTAWIGVSKKMCEYAYEANNQMENYNRVFSRSKVLSFRQCGNSKGGDKEE